MTKTLVLSMVLGVSFGQPAEGQTRPSTPGPQIAQTSPQLEQRDQPVTADDLAILVRVSGKRSLFCALQKACVDVPGSYDHRRVALQEVRFAVEDATRGRDFDHRLRDFNNLPETRFEDVQRVLALAKERVSARLKARRPGA